METHEPQNSKGAMGFAHDPFFGLAMGSPSGLPMARVSSLPWSPGRPAPVYKVTNNA
jgi:hypothetical protein